MWFIQIMSSLVGRELENDIKSQDSTLAILSSECIQLVKEVMYKMFKIL
jgi:hypothetical protein